MTLDGSGGRGAVVAGGSGCFVVVGVMCGEEAWRSSGCGDVDEL